MENVFDQWGSATHKDYKPGYRDTTGSEKNCHKRAEEVFKQCGNTDSQAVTASFTLKDGVSTSSSFPPAGNNIVNTRGDIIIIYSTSILFPRKLRQEKCGLPDIQGWERLHRQP